MMFPFSYLNLPIAEYFRVTPKRLLAYKQSKIMFCAEGTIKVEGKINQAAKGLLLDIMSFNEHRDCNMCQLTYFKHNDYAIINHHLKFAFEDLILQKINNIKGDADELVETYNNLKKKLIVFS